VNVTGPQDNRLSPERWNDPEMKQILADRDIAAVYRQLRRVGISQRHIAAMTGQSQSEVSEILKGRQVMAYDVLARIADGLGIPRGYMGLAYDPVTATSMVGPPDNALSEEDEAVKRRKLLAHGAAVMFGTAVLGADRDEWLPSPAQTPTPSNIGLSDVKQVEAATRAMRALDHQFGGGTCRDAVVAQLSWAERLLGASGKEEVRQRLFRALGDLQNLAGWATFDVGLVDSSRSHYATALEYAKQANDSDLLSNIMYRIGRLYLDQREPSDALKWFQLGQLAAQDAGSELAVSIMCGNEAWAYAMVGDEAQAYKLLRRAEDERARVNMNDAPPWAQWTHTSASWGSTYHELSAVDPRHATIAIPAITEASVLHGEKLMSRGKAFDLTMLATCHLRQGEVDLGVQVGRQALTLAADVKSKRVTDRLKPLQLEAARRTNNSDAQDLSHTIEQLRSA
jgi:transcriptional regulator with XRE-family HTH domain/tetratricopeptide (TPR) repeat protein